MIRFHNKCYGRFSPYLLTPGPFHFTVLCQVKQREEIGSCVLWVVVLIFFNWKSESVSHSVMSSSATPWTVACQAPLSMGYSRQEYWRGLLFCFPDLSNRGIEPGSPASQAYSLLPGKPLLNWSTVDLQCHANLYCIAEWLYTYMHSFFGILSHDGSSQDIE